MELKEFFSDWILRFLKSKDAISKKIASIENLSGIFDFKITYNDKVLYCLSREKFNDIFNILEAQSKNEHIWLTVTNSKENFDFLLNHWNSFIEFSNLTICFVNPCSSSEKKWIIKPALHNLVSEADSLVNGLKAISESVEQTTVEELKSKLINMP